MPYFWKKFYAIIYVYAHTPLGFPLLFTAPLTSCSAIPKRRLANMYMYTCTGEGELGEIPQMVRVYWRKLHSGRVLRYTCKKWPKEVYLLVLEGSGEPYWATMTPIWCLKRARRCPLSPRLTKWIWEKIYFEESMHTVKAALLSYIKVHVIFLCTSRIREAICNSAESDYPSCKGKRRDCAVSNFFLNSAHPPHFFCAIFRAQSGTGKTATFSIAVLQKVDIQLRETQALILSPTRELAVQIQKVVQS